MTLLLWRHRAVGDAYEAAKQSFRKIIPVITSDQVSYETRTISEKLIETALYELEDDQLCALAASFKLLAIAMEDGDAVAICGRLTTEEDIEAAKEIIVHIASHQEGKTSGSVLTKEREVP